MARRLALVFVIAACGKSGPTTKGTDFAAQYCATVRSPSPTCASAVAAAVPPAIDEKAARVALDAARAAANEPVPLDLPKMATSGEVATVFSIVLAVDGTTQIDGKPVPSDEAVLEVAKAAQEKNPDLRAVIKADSAVPHGRVIHVLDLLKQARIAKIAFGVQPVAPR